MRTRLSPNDVSGSTRTGLDPILNSGMGRVQNRFRTSFLDLIAEHPAQNIAVFSHGQFINAVAWLIETRSKQIDGRAMADWREYEITNHVPNCGGYTLTKLVNEANWRLSTLLPEERVKALSQAGSPLSDDSFLHAGQRLQE